MLAEHRANCIRLANGDVSIHQAPANEDNRRLTNRERPKHRCGGCRHRHAHGTR